MMIADRLKAIRASLMLTQAEMAARLNVSTRPYQNYESGERLPQAESLQAISALGFNVNWLLTGEGEMKLVQAPPVSAALTATAIDQELNARVVEAVSTVYKECGGRISPRDLGRVSAEIYNDIAQAGLSSWDEKMGALGLAAAQLRRRLLAPPEPASTQGKHSA